MKFKQSALGVVAAALLTTGTVTSAQARDTLQIAGSSTVLPFASIVAEEFGNAFPQFKTPVVGSGGSSGGLRQFCQGVGENTIDVANASRRIKKSEIESCASAGVNKIIEVRVGYDGIVFASNASKAAFKLTPRDLFMAAAAKIPQDGKLVDNKFTRWSQVNSQLPDQDIVLVVPASNHGTREVFEEKVLHAGCETFDMISQMDKKQRKAVCKALRKDGRIIEISGDYTETLARLKSQESALGVFGLSFYEKNRDRLKVATIDGVTPSLETVGSGKYPVSRPLFFYIKGEHIGVVPGLVEYAEFFLSDAVSGFGSPLETAGLIPLGDQERSEYLSAVQEQKIVELK